MAAAQEVREVHRVEALAAALVAILAMAASAAAPAAALAPEALAAAAVIFQQQELAVAAVSVSMGRAYQERQYLPTQAAMGGLAAKTDKLMRGLVISAEAVEMTLAAHL